MKKFSASSMLALVGQTNPVAAENKRGLIANSDVVIHSSKTKVLNYNLENHYGIILKRSQWAMQF